MKNFFGKLKNLRQKPTALTLGNVDKLSIGKNPSSTDEIKERIIPCTSCQDGEMTIIVPHMYLKERILAECQGCGERKYVFYGENKN